MAYICQCGCGREIPPSYLHGRRYKPRFLPGHNSKTSGFAAQMAQAKARRVAEMPTLMCQCGCGETIPPKPSHRYRPPKYIQAHYLKMGTHPRIAAVRKAKERARTAPPSDFPVPTGICECGCGKPTKIAKATRAKYGQYAGLPLRFIHGHHARLIRGAQNGAWKGGVRHLKDGYVMVRRPDAPGADARGYILEHKLVYQESRGIILPPRIDVHHINGDRADNRPENLIALTKLEHRRAHQIAAEVVALFVDDRLLDAARRHVRETGEIPDLEALTASVYGSPSQAS